MTAKPDMIAKTAITKKRTDLISAKKKLLDQMIETLKKPELPLEKKQQMLKEVEALKNTIKDDLTKLAQETTALQYANFSLYFIISLFHYQLLFNLIFSLYDGQK